MKKALTIGLVLCIALSIAVGSAGALSNSGGGTWLYQREITIQENSGKTLTNYQVLVELTGSDFPTETQSDGDDIRFTDADGKELSYWIEEYDYSGKHAKIWVKVPEIPASGYAKIYLHYGNPSASSVSDGDATFELFDDFEELTIDTNKWSLMSGDATINYGILTSSNINLRSKNNFGVNSALKYTAVHSDGNGNWIGFIVDGGRPFVLVEKHSWCGWIFHNCLSGNRNYGKALPSNYLNSWHTYEIIRDGITSTILYLDNSKTKYATLSQQITADNLPITLFSYISGSIQVDWIFVRKYISPEPTVTPPSTPTPAITPTPTPTPTPKPTDIAGSWAGTLYQPPRGLAREYPFYLNLFQSGTEVWGTSRIEWDSYYAIMKFSGTVSNGVLSFTETKIIEQYLPSGIFFIKNVVLNCEGDPPQVLEGSWDCPRYNAKGTISVNKIIPTSTPITPTPTPTENVQITKFVSPLTINQIDTTEITIFIENKGSFELEDILVIDKISEDFILIEEEIDKERYDYWLDDGIINFDIGSMLPGGTRVIQYKLRPARSGKFNLEPAIVGYYDPKLETHKTITSEPVSIEVLPSVPTSSPQWKGPLIISDVPTTVETNSKFIVRVKVKNPSKNVHGYYAIFKEQDIKTIKISTEGVQITDQPKIYPDYVGSDFYEKWEQGSLPVDVIVKGGAALILKKIDPIFVLGELTGTPTDPPGIVAMLAEWPFAKGVTQSTTYFTIITCNEKHGIQEGIPISPYTNLIIEIPVKAPSAEGRYSLSLSIPYEYTSTEVGGFGPGGMANVWYSVGLSSGEVTGTKTINVKRSRIPTPTPGIPGAGFAIVCLLAVAYLLRNRK